MIRFMIIDFVNYDIGFKEKIYFNHNSNSKKQKSAFGCKNLKQEKNEN